MNAIQLETIKQVDKLLDLALKGEAEGIVAIEKAKVLTAELIEFKDFNNHKEVWKYTQD